METFAAMMCLKHILVCFSKFGANQTDTGTASISMYTNNNYLEKEIYQKPIEASASCFLLLQLAADRPHKPPFMFYITEYKS